MHLCVREGNENLCRLLLEHNADVNIQDTWGYTPLHLCAREGNENLCRLLLEHNADVNIQDTCGYTPLHLCAREGNENLCRLLLEHNSMQRHPKFELSSAQKAEQTYIRYFTHTDNHIQTTLIILYVVVNFLSHLFLFFYCLW